MQILELKITIHEIENSTDDLKIKFETAKEIVNDTAIETM